MPSVLVVDDSPSIRRMVTHTLKSAGFETLEAGDGLEALEIARDQTANLVITDVNMPHMDGISLVSELRALPNYRFKPILILTTESSRERKAQGKAAGATGWIVKPFDPVQLLDVTHKVLN
ncbi:MAG: response regulator [Gammaproteobacteria bacterium]